jgi:hypothetical protein
MIRPPTISTLANAWPSVPPAKNNTTATAPPPSRIVNYKDLESHHGIAVGDAVKIVKTFQAYQFAKDLEGVVRKIVKDNHVYFCVELSDSDALNKIEQANTGKTFYPGQEQTLMCCKISHVQKLSSNKPAAVSGMSKPGKRPADAADDAPRTKSKQFETFLFCSPAEDQGGAIADELPMECDGGASGASGGVSQSISQS